MAIDSDVNLFDLLVKHCMKLAESVLGGVLDVRLDLRLEAIGLEGDVRDVLRNGAYRPQILMDEALEPVHLPP